MRQSLTAPRAGCLRPPQSSPRSAVVFERLYEHAIVLRQKLEDKKQRIALEEVRWWCISYVLEMRRGGRLCIVGSGGKAGAG